MYVDDIHRLSKLGRSLDRKASRRSRVRRVRRAPSDGLAPAVRRRPVVPRGVIVVVAVVLGGLAWLGSVTAQQAPAADASDRSEAVATAASQSLGSPGTSGFAAADELVLSLPGADARRVAFGQSTLPHALELAPVGRLERNASAGSFAPPPDVPGPAYHVLTAEDASPLVATSMVDVVLPSEAAVLAPVTGTVRSVRPYPLPDGGQDLRLVIQPDGHPELEVVLRAVRLPEVGRGDSVVAGETVVAAVRDLPYATVTDRAFGETEHVRIEVLPARDEQPIDPNAPALPVDALG
ncbi:MAG: hypothetical protein ACR2MA_11560 [Egibacteraceae bacterium]